MPNRTIRDRLAEQNRPVGPGADKLFGAIDAALMGTTDPRARIVLEALAPIDDLAAPAGSDWAASGTTDSMCDRAATEIYDRLEALEALGA